jgi:hypothetical protein
MSSGQTTLRVLLAALAVAAGPIRVRAQNVSAACRPLIDAEEKQIMTPSHVYMAIGPAAAGGTTTTSETISTGGVMYIMVRGKWIESPTRPQELLDRLRKSLATAKSYSCRRTGDASVDGVPAAVYTSHGENEGVRSDTRTWVAKATGLPLRSEEDVDAGGASGRTHVSVRYEYANVRAPAGGR